MNELQVFQNNEFGELGVLEVNGKPYFPATACAKVLGYVNPRDAIKRHCKLEGVVKHDGVSFTTNQYGTRSAQTVQANFIDEGNLYRLIVNSKLPAADRFERWVFDEVLPTIRKYGTYQSGAAVAPHMLAQISAELIKQMIPAITSVLASVVKGVNETTLCDEVPLERRRRVNGKIDRLSPYLKSVVEQMLMDGRTYREITEFLSENEVACSQMAVFTYSKKFFTTVEMLQKNRYRWNE